MTIWSVAYHRKQCMQLPKPQGLVIHGVYNNRPRATGMELIELGGITPTSVTTAVMQFGGVRS